jgi:hypothetical protein
MGVSLMRRFAFEADIYETLSCVPMAMRDKLDCAGLKISLEQWQSFKLSQRRRLCDLPIDTSEQLATFSDLIHQLMFKHCGAAPKNLSTEQQLAARPPSIVPELLTTNASLVGSELKQEQWLRLTEDERYALMKLGGGQRVKRNFAIALREFRLL